MIDTHIHITDKQYNEDRDEVLTTAKNEGVETFMAIGCDKQEITNTLVFIKSHPEFYAAIGYHPIEFKNVTDDDLRTLYEQLQEDNVVAIGEIGLDYYWYPDNKEEQEVLLRKQLDIAKALNLPIVIHAREALDDTYKVLKDYPGLTGTIHSFSGNGEEALKFIELGFVVGLTGPITFKNGDNQKDVAKKVPLDKLLIETDGPYLTPVPHRGKRNRPEYIYYVAQEIANQKGITVEEVLEATTSNFKRVFLGE